MSISNNTPSSTPVAANIQQIMNVVNEEMGKVTLLSCHEGEVAGDLSATQTAVAEKYKGSLEEYVKSTKTQQTVAIALTSISGALSGMASIGAGAGLVTAGASAVTFGSLAGIIGAVAQIGAPLTDAGASVGAAVMAVQVGKTEANQEEYGALNDLFGGTAGDAVDSVGSVIQTRTTVAGDLHDAIQNEAQASEYPAY